jgi:flagellar export protein FliJ
MAFDFPLHAVLHLRQSIERHQELRLRAANQQVARVQHGIEELDARRQQLQTSQSTELASGVTAAELRFGLQCEAELDRQRQELDLGLTRAQQLRDQQRALFQQARRARQTLEALREQQLRSYKVEAARREQRDLDDLFLLRREYLRHG